MPRRRLRSRCRSRRRRRASACFFGTRYGVGIGGGPGRGLMKPPAWMIRSNAPVDDQVVEDRKRLGPPLLDVDHVVVREAAHVQLAGRDERLGSLGDAVDDQAAGAADALPAVAVEGHRVAALHREPLVQRVQHLQERHVRRDVLHAARGRAALLARALWRRPAASGSPVALLLHRHVVEPQLFLVQHGDGVAADPPRGVRRRASSAAPG
jgi:hypothetical protein